MFDAAVQPMTSKGECEKPPDKKNRGRTKYDRFVLPYVAEFFGTTLLIFTSCASVHENVAQTGRLQPAVASGIARSICCAMTIGISGGHLNPAVSLGVVLAGGMHISRLLPYWIAQVCGGLVGAYLAKFVSSESTFGNTATAAAYSVIQTDERMKRALVAEVIMTFFLVLTACMTTCNKQSRTSLAPFYIGLALTACSLGSGAVSGGCLNPARALGPAVVENYWSYHWVYWAGPMIAAVMVGLVVRLVLGDPKTRLIMVKKSLVD